MNKPIKFSIAGSHIGPDFPPYIIAELSANHNGSLDRALDLISVAKRAGADAVKLQTYKAETITLNSDAEGFVIRGGLWNGKTLYELYDEAHTPWEWHEVLFAHARKIGITIFSSPFDNSAVDFLEKLNAPAYKIASFEIVDLPLVEYVAKTGKPMIISTGMANQEEIREAVEAARRAGAKQVALLHCVSGYPASPQDYNLLTIPDMTERFDVVTGLSDHTLGNATAIASIALGACLIEKHITLDRNGGGPDDSFSLEPKDLAQLCHDAKTAWASVGTVDYDVKQSEYSNVGLRRSLYLVRSLSKGSVISEDCLRSLRPSLGLAPKFLNHVIGRRVMRDVAGGSPLSWDMLESDPKTFDL